jgi:peptidoglycan hydrolase-like protein with peptidoglycan-binding domain
MVKADELTRVVQEDLAALGYDTGPVDGELSMPTAIAISKFQAEHDLEVTGELTVPLAGIIKAVGSGRYQPAAPAGAEPQLTGASMQPTSTGTLTAPPGPFDPMASAQAHTDLQARQQACIQEKVEAAQQREKKKRGARRLLMAAGRIAGRMTFGIDIGQITNDIFAVSATADDLAAAAKDLGLTEDELEECRNPPAEGGAQ